MFHTLASEYVDWNSMWKILVIGLVGGAGLTGVFSLGLVAFNAAQGGTNADGTPTRAHPIGYLGAGICLLVVLAGIAFGVDSMFDK